jgi:hypothetical protein
MFCEEQGNKMGDAADGVIGTVLLLGDIARGILARAADANDLGEIRCLLKEADDIIGTIVRQAKTAQSEIDNAPSP